MSLRRLLPWCFALLALTTIVADANAEPKKLLTAAERKEMAAILAEFRKLKPEAEERIPLVDKLAALGPPAVEAAKTVVEKELNKALLDYGSQFSAATTKAYAARITKNNVEEVAVLRDKVMQLQKKEDLSKDDITSVADPALARLKEIFLLERDVVFQQNTALKDRRELLLLQGRVWKHCESLLKQSDDSKPPAAVTANAEPETFDSYLAQEEELNIFRVMPIGDDVKKVTAYNNQLAGRIDAQEMRCIQQANLMRCLLGLNALKIDERLCAAARGHSQDMKKLNFFDHRSPVPGKTSFTDRAQLTGTSSSAENIAAGTTDGAAANLMWWHSPGHHKNMLGAHDRIGVGREDGHWTEMFGG